MVNQSEMLLVGIEPVKRHYKNIREGEYNLTYTIIKFT